MSKTAEDKMKRNLEIALWAGAAVILGWVGLVLWILIQAARVLTSL